MSDKKFYEKYKMLPPNEIISQPIYDQSPALLIRFCASIGQIIGAMAMMFIIVSFVSDDSSQRYHSETKEEAERNNVIRGLEEIDARKEREAHYY